MNQMQLKKDVADAEKLVKEFMELGDLESWEERYIVCTELEAKIKICRNKADLYASRDEVITVILYLQPRPCVVRVKERCFCSIVG